MNLEIKKNAQNRSSLSTKKLRHIHQLWATTLVCSAVIATPQIANAGTTTLSGSQNATQSVTTDTDPVVTVNTTDDFEVNVAAGDALVIEGSGSITYNDGTNNSSLVSGDSAGLLVASTGDNSGTPGSVNITTGGTITGSSAGVYVTNAGTGSTSITTSGTVTSVSGVGLYVYVDSPANTGGVSINAADIDASTYGISAENYGAGNTNITVTGTITTDTIHGIIVDHSGAELTIETAGISAGETGIVVTNRGLDITRVTTTGTVAGGTKDAIYIDNNNALNTGGIVVSTETATGNQNGITLFNRGLGDTSVTATGTVTGTTAYGMDIVHSGEDLTVVAVDVTGSFTGIRASNTGTGITDITTTGTVTGDSSSGIYVAHSSNGGVRISTAAVEGETIGIEVGNSGTGNTSITATGTVTGGNNNGIHVLHFGNDLTLDAVDVTGGAAGIYATNAGAGITDITTTGTVTGLAGNGISVSHNAAGSGVTLSVAQVTGSSNGISVDNFGAGSNTSITATGTVTGENGHGISVAHFGEDVTIEAATVTGSMYGISVTNSGTGQSRITATGAVTGNSGDGINASNLSATNSAGMTISAVGVTGGSNGIFVQNTGTGQTSITATGAVTGSSGDGVYATHLSATNNSALTVSVAGVSGNVNGIHIDNAGTGNTSVVATGLVSGTVNDGISIAHYGAAVTVEATDVTGNMNGVYVDNFGTGLTDITTTGLVTSAGFGIHVTNGVDNVGGITVVAANIDTDSTGIYTFNQGTGNTSVTANGMVTSSNSFGIRAHQMNASGLMSVTTNGVVEGNQGGVYLESISAQASTLTINSDSEVRNLSLNPVDLAIETVGNSGGIVNIINQGTVTGVASLDDQDDTFNNSGVWNMAGGTSNFQGGTDTLNNSGAFLGANTTGLALTIINNVEVVNNTGAIVMQNRDSRIGGASAYTGDVVIFSNGGSGQYQSNGGGLYVDTDFENAISDRLVVDNANLTGAPTRVFVDPSSPVVPVFGEGIQVVEVLGTSDDNAFRMGNSVGFGLYRYELARGLSPQTEQSWYLRYTNTVRDEGVAAQALSILGSRTALATLSNLHERQRGGEIFSDEHTGRKGVWGRAFGLSSEFSSDGGTRAGYDATTWGAQAGMDLLASEGDNGARTYAGVYLAHASSSGDALNGSSRIGKLDIAATSLGAYYTKHAASGWYVDVVGQYSRLGGARMRTSGGTQRPDGSGYALSLEGGQRFNRDGKINTELQAQLIYQKTDLDDVTLADGNRLNISNVSAVTGRLGVRLIKNPSSGGRLQPWLRANLWHTFNKDATVGSLGTKASTPYGGTSGEVQLGFALTPSKASGWSAYVAGGYLFDLSGSEYSGWKGTLGVRKGW